jgi:hypothetical protein
VPFDHDQHDLTLQNRDVDQLDQLFLNFIFERRMDDTIEVRMRCAKSKVPGLPKTERRGHTALRENSRTGEQ